MDMELIFLGTGSAYPCKTRGASCIMLKHTGDLWMFDCGEGSQIQAQKIKSVKPRRLKKVFITHLHGDHLFGLPGFLNTYSQAGAGSEVEGGPPDPPLEIYGPRGLRAYMRACLLLSRSDLRRKFIVHELVPPKRLPRTDENGVTEQRDFHYKDPSVVCEDPHPNESPGGRQIKADSDLTWHLFSEDGFTVNAGWLRHRVPCFGYVIQEDDLPGRLDAAKLKALGVKPGPDYAKIKAGESITTTTGETVTPSQVLGPSRRGRRLAVLGDSCDSSLMTSLCRHCDVMVHETTLENALWESCVDKGHSTPEMAANFAKSAGVKQLIITHFSQRYKSPGEELEEGDDCVDKLLHQAQAVFGDDVIAADDLLVVPVPAKKSS